MLTCMLLMTADATWWYIICRVKQWLYMD